MPLDFIFIGLGNPDRIHVFPMMISVSDYLLSSGDVYNELNQKVEITEVIKAQILSFLKMLNSIDILTVLLFHLFFLPENHLCGLQTSQ